MEDRQGPSPKVEEVSPVVGKKREKAGGRQGARIDRASDTTVWRLACNLTQQFTQHEFQHNGVLLMLRRARSNIVYLNRAHIQKKLAIETTTFSKLQISAKGKIRDAKVRSQEHRQRSKLQNQI
ncbi:hypothetical protein WN51_02770 [Melipona quadrifasciata]|uniref:Uncharacterized protein n=1 Tax=Melipona quadrifasciata TaxID=166423 RepID=A0A0N0BJR0_9HYME|nr:hypothetical protein WN51_02770 [Melipona quadrifasciata]